MMPAAPFVGAVTTRPPAAFSSFTASANRLTQSMTRSGSVDYGSWHSRRYSSGARRRTLQAAGQRALMVTTPFCDALLHHLPDVRAARPGSPPRCARLVSFASITPLIDSPDSRAAVEQLGAGA